MGGIQDDLGELREVGGRGLGRGTGSSAVVCSVGGIQAGAQRCQGAQSSRKDGMG